MASDITSSVLIVKKFNCPNNLALLWDKLCSYLMEPNSGYPQYSGITFKRLRGTVAEGSKALREKETKDPRYARDVSNL